MRRFVTVGVLFALVALVLPAPSASAATAPSAPPGIPTNVSATAGTLAATISWTPSGQPATSFTVTSNPGGISATVDGMATSATVTGLAFAMSYTFSVAGTNSLGAGPASAPSNAVSPDPPGGPFHQGLSVPLLNRDISAGKPVATNLGDDPVYLPGISAVVLNMTASKASVSTSVQVVVNKATVQTISVARGQVQSSLVVVAVPAQLSQAAIQVTAGSAHVQLDFVGYFTGPKTLRNHAGLLEMVSPATLLDSSVAIGSTTNIRVLGQGNIPSTGVAEVLVNVIAAGSTGAGAFTLLPTGGFATGTTTLGFAAGETTANRAIVPVPSNGSLSLVDRGAGARAHVDVLGWFTDATDTTAMGSLYTAVAPVRIVDTASNGGPLSAGASVSFPVAGQGGVPPNSSVAPPTSALFQVTALAPAGAGSISLSGVSVVDFAAGQTVSSVDLVHLASDGSTSLTVTGAATNVIVDIVAYFSGDTIVPGSTEVLSSDLLAAITNLGSDLSITFRPGTQVSPPIQLNDVIAAGFSAATPDGFLRRVTSISTLADGSTVLGTRVALLTEAVTAFSIEWVTPRNFVAHGAFAGELGRAQSTLAAGIPAASTTPFPPPIGTSIDPNYPAISIARPPQSLTVDLGPLGLGASNLTVNDFELQLLVNFKMSGNPFLGEKLHLNVGFSVGVRAAIELQLLAQLALLKETTLLDLFFKVGPPIFLFIGVIPLEFQPGIEAKLTYQLKLNGGLIFGLNVDRYGAVSGGYDGTNFFVDQPVYKDYLPPNQTFTMRLSVQAQSELDLHLIPSLEFYGGVGKIGAEVKPFAALTVDPTAPVWWDVTLGICREFQADLQLIFASKAFVFLPVCVNLLTFNAPGPKLDVTIVPASATVARSAKAHFQAGVAGGTNGVTWSINDGAQGGSLSNATLTDVDYTAPRRAGTYTLHAAANDDPTSFGEAVITVPADAPSPPLTVGAAAGRGSALINWTAPADDGGVPLSGYQVTASPGDAVFATGANTTTVKATGLTPGTSYTFTVTATNSAGLTSGPSLASTSVTILPLLVNPAALDFGAVVAGQVSQPQTVQVLADPAAPLLISTVALGGANSGDFAIQSDQCSTKTIPSGGSCTFAVVFKPTSQGTTSSAVVTVTDSDASSPQLVALSGKTLIPGAAIGAIFDLQMLDAQHGFAVDGCCNSITGPSQIRGVLATVDGGKTWGRVQLPADVTGASGLQADGSLRFVGAQHGWFQTCRPNVPTPAGLGCVPVVVGTTDGGQTWQDLGSLPYNLYQSQLTFVDDQHGWVLGTICDVPTPLGFIGFTICRNVLFGTVDGGLTWSAQTLPDPLAGAACPVLNEIQSGVNFSDVPHGWVLGESYCYSSTFPFSLIRQEGVAWSTSDGGVTWTAHELASVSFLGGSGGTVQRPQLPSATQMRAAAILSFSSPVLEKTDDGGTSFTSLAMPDVAWDVQFTDATNGVMVGRQRGFWRTSDGGNSWVQIGTLPLIPGTILGQYTRVDVVDANNIWISGVVYIDLASGRVSAGFVQKSSDGGATWSTQLVGDGSLYAP